MGVDLKNISPDVSFASVNLTHVNSSSVPIPRAPRYTHKPYYPSGLWKIEGKEKGKEELLSYDAFVEKYKDQYGNFYIGPDYIEVEPFEDVYLNNDRYPTTIYKVVNSIDYRIPNGYLVLIGFIKIIKGHQICKVSDVELVFPQKSSEDSLQKEADLYSAALYKG